MPELRNASCDFIGSNGERIVVNPRLVSHLVEARENHTYICFIGASPIEVRGALDKVRDDIFATEPAS